MQLNQKNYFSDEADLEYMSNSQFKAFAGNLAESGCEAAALAKLQGIWDEKPSVAMKVGSYVDAYFEGTLMDFKMEHPEILKKNGELYAEYLVAEKVIKRVERDEYFMKFMSGEKQRIFTAEMFGCKWKCKLDSFIPGVCITDLKVMRSIKDGIWTRNAGRTNFVRAYGYDIQAALYQSIVHIVTGQKLPFFIAAASKEPETDIEIIGFEQRELDIIMGWVEDSMPRVLEIKHGRAYPRRCDRCDYCLRTKILTKPKHFMELEN